MIERRRVRIGPYAMLVSAQLAVGAAAIFARFALSGAPPLAVSAWRLVIASAVLLAIAGIRGAPRLRSGPLDGARGRSIPHDDTGSIPHDDTGSIPHDDTGSIPHDDTGSIPHDDRRWVFIAAGIALAAHFGTWIASLDYTSVAVSTLLVATTPIWTALYDSTVHKRHLSLLAYGAFVIGAVGLLLVVGFNHARPPIAGHEYFGDALAIIGAIAIGAYFILIRIVRDNFGTRAIVTRTYSCAALALLVASLLAHQSPPAFSDATAWGGILAMALISQLLGHTAMNASLRWFSPSSIGMSTLIEPVIAAVLAFFIFGEKLTPLALCGGVLILVALAVFLREEASLQA